MDKKRVLTVGAVTAALVIPTVGIAVAQSAYEPVDTQVLAAAYESSSEENAGQRGQGRGNGHGRQMGGGGGQGMDHDHSGEQGGGHGQGGMMGGGQGKGGGQGGGMALATEPAGELSDELEAQLIYLAEEEKVAHDLYVLADEKYGSDTDTYGNISQSETRHFSAMNRLLDLYGLDSTTDMGTPGEDFADDKLEMAYNASADKVEDSAEAAAAVGVEAEETDIADLKAALAMDNVPSDVERVLSNLVRASENHLSAFKNLQGQL